MKYYVTRRTSVVVMPVVTLIRADTKLIIAKRPRRYDPNASVTIVVDSTHELLYFERTEYSASVGRMVVYSDNRFVPLILCT